MDGDVRCLKQSVDHAEAIVKPWPHFILSKLFEADLLADLVALPLEPTAPNYLLGRREEFNAQRRYLNPPLMAEYPVAERTVAVFSDASVIEAFEKKGGCSLKGSFLRIEYALDSGGFWLEPHTDIGPKLLTLLIFLSPGPEAEGWGTDLYKDCNTHHACLRAVQNTALLFYPAENTWHGFEKRDIQGTRKMLIVNYVTTEWRSRQELVHPEKSVYP